MSDQHHRSDRSAAFTGLILGAVAIGITVYSIVILTNKHFQGEAASKAGAGEVK